MFRSRDVKEFDPFLMLDAFDSRNPEDYVKGFPWHPHRGIETVTYLISGDIEHGDSLGNRGHILSGGCQWMTAGSGIVHQEMPQPAERMLGLQLWLNLPRADKWTDPQYRDITAALIPKVREESGGVSVISGTYGKAQGATQGDYVPATILDVDLKPGAPWRPAVDSDATLFIYIVQGEGLFASASAPHRKPPSRSLRRRRCVCGSGRVRGSAIHPFLRQAAAGTLRSFPTSRSEPSSTTPLNSRRVWKWSCSLQPSISMWIENTTSMKA